jgi:hypothetical protein
MRVVHGAQVIVLALALAGCVTNAPEPRPIPDDSPTRDLPPDDSPTRDFPVTNEVRDSVYLPVDRTSTPPAGYGLYTVILARAPNMKTVRVLSEMFATVGGAENAAIARENLNLITIPVKDAEDAARVLASARNEPEDTATAVMQTHYDFDQAALLMAGLCRTDRSAEVMNVCGSTTPDGPLLVTALTPLDGSLSAGQRLLIVNLSTTPPGALPEVLAAYRRQILRQDYADRAEMDGWRLWALNQVLNAANLLPGITKAYADNL